MTNEKAIQLLHRLSDEQFDGIHGDERREALDMAVRALEPNLVQESDSLVKELVKDCISRQMAIDAMWKIRRQQQMLDDTHKADLVMQGIYLAEKALEKLPSAQPQRKTGKWITVPGRFGDEVECENCHSVFWYWMGNYGFCPNCGADMRGEIE